MRRGYALFVALLIGVLPAFLSAQSTITGTVTDAKGKPLLGVNVYLKGTSLGDVTDVEGRYRIEKVPAGTYELIASIVGYKQGKRQVKVVQEGTVAADFALETDVLNMDEVVIQGTPGGAGLRKRDASFAITTLDATEIKQFSPASTANLLELVPGVWSESSGGVSGANIFVRGMPSSGDAPFVTIALNGGPIYGVETLSFLEQSTLFRLDETVEFSEAQRGGPSSVFSNGEPGMTVNFKLRKGSERTKGRIKYETSDYALQRVDGFVSGKLATGLYYMIGGYVSTSPGIRSTQFNAEEGRQLTVQLTRVYEGGMVNIFSRMTDDHGQWVLPMALNTGNDLGTFAQLGNATRFRTLPLNAQGDSATFDFAKGRGWNGSVSGLNATFDLGNGWVVRDNLTYTEGDANTFGFVPNGNPVLVDSLKNSLGRDTIMTRGGEVLAGNEWVQNYGHWVVLKNLKSVNNDLSLNKRFDAHNFTIGIYQAFWSANDFWTLGNHIPVHNVANGDVLESDITAADVAAAGGGGPWNYGIQSAGDARVFAIYGADSWQMNPQLRIDIGYRWQKIDLQYTLDHGAIPDGTIDKDLSLSGQDMAYTAAVNYDLNKSTGIFARFSRSYLFPQFDNLREDKYKVDDAGNLISNTFMQYEIGLKYDSRPVSLFATGFMNNVDVFDSDVGSVRAPALLTTQTKGLELDGALALGDLVIRAVGTFQSGTIKDADVDTAVIGNSIWRQPNVQFRVSPSYTLDLGKFKLNIYGAYRMVGKRWDSRSNVFQLDSYSKLDLGFSLSTGGGLAFGLHIDNLTDSEGLTEGDPRDPTAANGRPIFGRSIKISVAQDF